MENTGKKASNLINLTGLWKSKDGMYLSGTINGGVRLLVFPNKNKTEDKHPDYNACLAPVERKEEAPKVEADVF